MQTLIIVQSRINSNRLPYKALYPFGGVPLIGFILKRLLLLSDKYKVVLATSDDSNDDILEHWAHSLSIPVVRGSKDNVYSRYLKVINLFPCKSFIRVTADNPFVCLDSLKNLEEFFYLNQLEYSMSRGLPFGTGVDIFNSDTFKAQELHKLNSYQTEHINAVFLDNIEQFRIKFWNASQQLTNADISLTIDTIEQWKEVQNILTPEDIKPWELSLNEILQRLGK